MPAGTFTSASPRNAPAPITCAPSNSWKIAATTRSLAASATTAASSTKPCASHGPANENTTAATPMITHESASVPKPIDRNACTRPSPTALPMRMLTAIESPSGNIKVNAAQLSAI